jgi:hypothetical protein
MSLVHEALEKAAREKQRKTGSAPFRGSGLPAATLPAPSGSGLPTATPRRSRLPWLLAGVALIAVLAALWFAAKAYRQVEQALTPSASAPAKVIDPPVAARTPLPPPPPAPVPVTESRYKISGIMRDPDGTFVAVINGKVVSETHYVDGATVKKIERDRVTLDVDGKETVVRLF